MAHAAITFEPAYLALSRSGELEARALEAQQRLLSCDLCARGCHVDRRHGHNGIGCRTGLHAIVNSHAPHHGEERCLSGRNGSGTVFFSWCDMRCVFCQNWDISRQGAGREVSTEELASMMLELQALGCHNINLVSPSHVIAQILSAVSLAARRGLRLPLVYNTGGFDSPAGLRLLDGVIDVYLPDMKYGDEAMAQQYSLVKDYVAVNQAAVKEMHRQVGDLRIGADGIARRGLLVRHLVMPNGVAGSDAVLRFIAEQVSRDTMVNIMDQYRPCYRAHQYEDIARRPTEEEIASVLAMARGYGLERLAD